MPNEVSSLRKKEVQVLFSSSLIRLSYPGLCVEDIALPLDPSVLGDVFSVVPTLRINNVNTIIDLDRLGKCFWGFFLHQPCNHHESAFVCELPSSGNASRQSVEHRLKKAQKIQSEMEVAPRYNC